MEKTSLVLAIGISGDDFSRIKKAFENEDVKVVEVKPEKISSSPLRNVGAVLLEVDALEAKYLQIFKKIKRFCPAVATICITPFEPLFVEKTLRLIREGAFDYLKKPYIIDELKILVRKALKETNYRRRGRISDYLGGNGPFLGKSVKIKKALLVAKEAAANEETVLIEGESGTGKDFFARLIHSMSSRKNRPFLTLNCANLVESLVESELFGYEKGAFTDATDRKIGLFSAANGGTLFLNEISETPLHLQAKLLQVVEEKKFIPLGATKPVGCNVRLICATNKNLREEIKKGRFREDLFYRINVFYIYLPPLRERKEDIPLFIDYFLKKYCCQFNKERKEFTKRACQFLLDYPWPGNIRELESVIMKAVVLTKNPLIKKGEIEEIICPSDSFSQRKNFFLPFERAKKKVISDFEEDYIRELLEKCRGNVTLAARKAKVTRSFLYRKIKEFEIDIASYRQKFSFEI